MAGSDVRDPGHSVRRPGPPLSTFVRRITGYRTPIVDVVHHGLPSPDLTLVIGLDGPVRVGWSPSEADSQQLRTMASGMHSAPAYVFPGLGVEGIQLDVTPAGARALFGTPAAELHADIVDFGDLRGGAGVRLVEQLADHQDWATRLDITEQVLLQLVQPDTEVRSELAWAWQQIVRGEHRMDQLENEIGWSRGYFTRLFAGEFGVKPKETARIVRFDRARRALQQQPPPGAASVDDRGSVLAQTAAEYGFADQAHLTREWRRLAGCTPTDWLTEMSAFVQDA